jgi:hypothetical protein
MAVRVWGGGRVVFRPLRTTHTQYVVVCPPGTHKFASHACTCPHSDRAVLLGSCQGVGASSPLDLSTLAATKTYTCGGGQRRVLVRGAALCADGEPLES